MALVLLRTMIYLILGSSIALLSMIVGYYLTMYTLHSKASQLIDNIKKAYPREFEVWKCGYRQALSDIFD